MAPLSVSGKLRDDIRFATNRVNRTTCSQKLLYEGRYLILGHDSWTLGHGGKLCGQAVSRPSGQLGYR